MNGVSHTEQSLPSFTEISPQYQSVSWMVANREISYLLQSYPELQSTCKREQSGRLHPTVAEGVKADAHGHRIYRPAKTATQSGDWHGHHWRMDWDILQKGHRWENPLMGWQSSADYVQGTHLNFVSREDAIHFAQKQGYEYFVQEPNERKFVPKAYANNFLHSPKKLKKIPTK